MRLRRVIQTLLFAGSLSWGGMAWGLEPRASNPSSGRPSCVAPTQRLEAIIPALLQGVRTVLENYYGDEPGRPGFRVDQSSCDTATGVLASLLEQLGFVQGQDYEIMGTGAHVFIHLKKEGKILDPTFAQTFQPGSPGHREAMVQGGFYGTRAELHRFILRHEESIRFGSFSFLRHEGYQSRQCLTLGLQTAAELEECQSLFRANLVQALDGFFWGTEVQPERSLVIASATSNQRILSALLQEPDGRTPRTRIRLMREVVESLRCGAVGSGALAARATSHTSASDSGCTPRESRPFQGAGWMEDALMIVSRSPPRN
jgi:hypothetical protein